MTVYTLDNLMSVFFFRLNAKKYSISFGLSGKSSVNPPNLYLWNAVLQSDSGTFCQPQISFQIATISFGRLVHLQHKYI